MENGAWTDGLNFGNKMRLSIEEIECKIALYIGAGHVLCKRLFGLFGAFVLQMGDLQVGSLKR